MLASATKKSCALEFASTHSLWQERVGLDEEVTGTGSGEKNGGWGSPEVKRYTARKTWFEDLECHDFL